MSRSPNLDALISSISEIPRYATEGHVSATTINSLEVKGLERSSKVGDLVQILPNSGTTCFGEILALRPDHIQVFPECGLEGLALHDRVRHVGAPRIMPDQSWLGRVIDPFLRPLDGRPLAAGSTEVALKADPPPANQRKTLGPRVNTGLAAVDALFPLVRGQRMGIFAGSGVGKSTLLADFAKGVAADVTVIALVGERGRELRHFTDVTLGSDGMKKSVVIAATSDQPAMTRRRAAWVAMSVAEHFRNQGLHVLFLIDSVTRFAEAHREIATSSGELPGTGGFPASTAQELMSLCERAGPGASSQGDITAIFSVLVEGSNLDGAIADTMRGILDGHLVLKREIAERGRFPAIDTLSSLSRNSDQVMTASESKLATLARELTALYERTETMIQAGLYATGSDEKTDLAITARPKLEAFLSRKGNSNLNKIYQWLESSLMSE